MVNRTNSPLDESSLPVYSEEPGQVIGDTREAAIASVTATKGWKELVNYINVRQEFYKHYLPGGTPLTQISDDERGKWWGAASEIIKELELLKNSVEVISGAVKKKK